MNDYQDLCCQLHIHNIYSVDALSLGSSVLDVNKATGRSREWDNVPPVVCVVLVVPRKNIEILEHRGAEMAGTPSLQCDVRATTSESIFSSIQTVFGEVAVTGSNSNTRIIVDEDPAGYSGNSPVIAFFWVPSWLLMADPQSTTVSLTVHSTPQTAMVFLPKLGMEMNLFVAKLMDTTHVHLTTGSPKTSGGPLKRIPSSTKTRSMSQARSTSRQVVVDLDRSCRQVLTMAAREVIIEENTKAALTNRAAVSVEQVSPCGIKIAFGRFQRLLAFPFPVDGTRCKLRIARKSSYVEVS